MDATLAHTPETPPRSRWRAMGLPLLAGGAVAGIAAAVHFRDPHQEGSWGICPFYELTGFWCPGCGGLRGLHNLTDGRVLDAVQSNLLLFPLLLGFVAWWGYWMVRSWRGQPAQLLPRGLPRPLLWVTLVFLVAYTVFRNTPWGSWLVPV
ncbi:DUF2752 domain-containing protein [Nocardia otitidiscaviarum]|uniref:DUF2752 domain-containing protein n=1 Tax=Nocardia otitidiscaviarum TaxID=1823 RepID=UPI002B4B424E|nr:DUF2752 domain-containing protein [Nocardia otitidiscaviarum]